MIERYLHNLKLDDAGDEDISATRSRLKIHFEPGVTRRMTQLGMLIGAAMSEITPQAKDSIVYASSFAESCALETYLDSFPHASPTLFQTSIHPSAVQQALIGRQQSIGEFLPMTGRLHLVGQALHAAMISPCERVIVCGGEERGTWLLDNGIASERSFAFAFALTNEVEHAVARLRLSPAQNDESQSILLSEFFDRLVRREPINQSLCMGLHLQIQWI